MSFADLLNPGFDEKEASRFAEEHFGINADASMLVSERDQNFLLTQDSGEKTGLIFATKCSPGVFKKLPRKNQ